MPTRALSIVAFTLLALVACSGPPDAASASNGAAAASGAIDSVVARYVDAVKAGDTVALAATLSDDAEVVFPTGPIHQGRSAVVGAFAEMFANLVVLDLQRTNVHRLVARDLAVETGGFSIEMRPTSAEDAPTMTDVGVYLIVWARQVDGTWLLARGFNRSDAPLAAAP